MKPVSLSNHEWEPRGLANKPGVYENDCVAGGSAHRRSGSTAASQPAKRERKKLNEGTTTDAPGGVSVDGWTAGRIHRRPKPNPVKSCVQPIGTIKIPYPTIRDEARHRGTAKTTLGRAQPGAAEETCIEVFHAIWVGDLVQRASGNDMTGTPLRFAGFLFVFGQ